MNPYSLLARADCRRGIPLADRTVQTVVTSPPYWGLRDYGEPGQIGLESTPDAYVARMVEVFRDIRRVLRDDGTVWLNLGDSYSSGGRSSQVSPSTGFVGHPEMRHGAPARVPVVDGLKPKDLIGIPWRVALALQADGWYLRSDIVWSKPNPMPESVTDRPTRSHEYIFLLTKRANYYYDHEAIRERSRAVPHARGGVFHPAQVAGPNDRNGSSHFDAKEQDRVWAGDGRANKRSVWTVAKWAPL